MPNRPYDPYVQQTPRFGGSVDLVPPGAQDSSRMVLEMAMPTHYDKPSGATEPPVRSTTAGQQRRISTAIAGTPPPPDRPAPTRFGPLVTPEKAREIMDKYREFDRRRFKNIYDNERVEQVAVGRKWDRDTTNMVHGGLDTLKEQDPGDWQLVEDVSDTVSYMEMESGQVVKMNKTTGDFAFNEGY